MNILEPKLAGVTASFKNITCRPAEVKIVFMILCRNENVVSFSLKQSCRQRYKPFNL